MILFQIEGENPFGFRGDLAAKRRPKASILTIFIFLKFVGEKWGEIRIVERKINDKQ